ncbi:hypothetical protein [Streptomyces sp. NPDC003952]
MATDSTVLGGDPLMRGLLNRIAQDGPAEPPGPPALTGPPGPYDPTAPPDLPGPRCLPGPQDADGLPGLPDPRTLLRLMSNWHQRGLYVGFPDLTVGRR